MFEQLTTAPADKILVLSEMFRQDARANKVDLGVGVYKDVSGNTPIFAAIKEAESILNNAQKTKSYMPMSGHDGFNDAMQKLALGQSAVDSARICKIQAPGGSGALRLLSELLQLAIPGNRVWLSNPSWGNHQPLIQTAGLQLQRYRYFDANNKNVNFTAMMQDLDAAQPGEIVLLHACCHNPTGANLSLAQWGQLSDFLVERKLVPFIDMAYQGFGDGLEEDAQGMRSLLERVEEALIAVSCSKNFGVYRERVGCALVLAREEQAAQTALSQLKRIARTMYSLPPDHGAAVVATVLSTPTLYQLWYAELEQMRLRMLKLRQMLAEALRHISGSNDFDFIAEHRGMFSMLSANEAQVLALRDEYAIYVVEGGRINIAGLSEKNIDYCAQAFCKVLL